MKRKSLILLVCCLLFFLSIISACGENDAGSEQGLVGGAATLVKEYQSLDELVADAAEITEINVLSQETITYQDIPFTISTVSVLATFKGTLKVGDTIRIIETGGEFYPTDKVGKKLPKQTFKLNGIPVLEKGGHEIVMLSKFTGPQVEGDVYTPLGVYQGRFKFDSSGKLVQQVPESQKIKDYKPINKEKFVEQIKTRVHK
jgi:hypothetical protein